MKQLKRNKIKLFTLIIFVLLIFMILLGFTNSLSKEEIYYKTETIVKGDTLWSIAEKEGKNNNYYQNKDIRSIVQELKYINELTEGNLKEGMELKIPVI